MYCRLFKRCRGRFHFWTLVKKAAVNIHRIGSLSFQNKGPQTGRLKQQTVIFLTVLGAGSLRAELLSSEASVRGLQIRLPPTPCAHMVSPSSIICG